MNGFVVVGLNHKSAPVELRERCRVDDLPGMLAEVRELAPEVAILGTCNRFEVYAHGTRDPARILDWVAARAGVGPADVRRHAYVRAGRNACKHLFFVASSLDSLVVGETQVRRQVRDAYQAATEAGAVGAMLHRLFQAALRVSKEIADQTGVGRGNVSVAGAAADLAERVFGDLHEAKVLVLGAGETAELVMTHLAARGVAAFRVVNRTVAHAQALAERYGAACDGLEHLDVYLPEADIWVAAATGERPLIDIERVRGALRRRRGRPLVAIDIAMPRAVDARVDDLDNVYRYDMEALAELTRDALRHRRKEFLQCCTLVDGAVLRLAEETRAREAGHAISELEHTYAEIAERELAALERRLPDLEDEQREQVRRSVRRIVRKLLHRPVRALRESSPDEHEVIRRAFGAPERGEP